MVVKQRKRGMTDPTREDAVLVSHIKRGVTDAQLEVTRTPRQKELFDEFKKLMCAWAPWSCPPVYCHINYLIWVKFVSEKWGGWRDIILWFWPIFKIKSFHFRILNRRLAALLFYHWLSAPFCILLFSSTTNMGGWLLCYFTPATPLWSTGGLFA